MSLQELEAFLAPYGLKVDDKRQGAGKFHDLYVGIGQPLPKLYEALDGLKQAQYGGLMQVTRLDHPPEYCLELGSFWVD